MMVDKIDLLDNDYNLVSREASSRQIKTRKKSFSSIKIFFIRGLSKLGRAERKLDRSMEKLVNQKFKANLDTQTMEKKIEKKTRKIAELEKKIMILSRESVPKNYVEDRAIKLRKNMMENLRFNSSNTYSLGIKDEVDEEEAIDKIFYDEQDLTTNNSPKSSDLEDVDDVDEEVQEDIETPESIMNRESEKIGQSVSNILDEESAKKSESTDEVSENQEEKINATVVDDSTPIADISEFMKGLDLSAQSYSDSENDKVSENDTDKTLDREQIEVVPTNIDRDAIRSSIDDQFENVARNGSEPEEETIISAGRPNMSDGFTNSDDGTMFVSPETVKSVVGPGSKIDIDVEEPKNISPEEVRAVIDGKMDNIEATESGDEIDTPLDVKSIEETISEALDRLDIQNQENDTDDEMSFENIHEDVEDAINERNRVSSNESHTAKINEFDSDGNKKKRFNYVPMTDEEIKASQDNIEYEKYENQTHLPNEIKFNYPKIKFEDIFKPVSKNENDYKIESEEIDVSEQDNKPVNDNIRGDIVVVPDRVVKSSMVNDENKENEEVIVDEPIQESEEEPIEDYTFDVHEDEKEAVSSDEEDLSFDFSNTSAREINNIIDKLGTKSEFDALKARVEQLRQQQIEQRRKEEKARQEAEEAARKAEEEKKRYNESIEKNNQSLELFKSFIEALEEDNERTKQRTQAFEETKEMENRFAEDQRVKTEQALAMVNEINSIIGPVAENVSVVKR